MAACIDCLIGLHELNRPITPFDSSTVAILDPDHSVHAHTGPSQNHSGPFTTSLTVEERDVITLTVSASAEDDLLGFSWSDVNEHSTASTQTASAEVESSCQCEKGHVWIRYYKTMHYYTCNCNDFGCTCDATIYMWKKAYDTSGSSALPPCNPIEGCDE